MSLVSRRFGKWWMLLLPLAVASVTLGIYFTWRATPPALPETMDDALALVRSSRYQRLPEYRRREYLSHIHGLMEGLDEEQRQIMREAARDDPLLREALGQARRHEMMERTKDYARATPDEQLKILDAMIDRMEAGRRGRPEGQRRGADGRPPSGDGGSRRQRAQERIKQRIEQGNPQHMALIGEFFRALRARREARGIGSPR